MAIFDFFELLLKNKIDASFLLCPLIDEKMTVKAAALDTNVQLNQKALSISY